MKANELRIGNLVNHYNQTIEVDGIDDIDVFNKNCGEIPIHSISPIPLTEGWLLKLGFDNENRPYWLDLLSSYEIRAGNVSYMKGIQSEIQRPIRYVHEYQNLHFALTGEELTIKQP